MFKKLSEAIKRKPIIGWAIFGVVMVCVFLLGLLAASITERRAEIASIYNNKVRDIGEGIEPRSELWGGENYPREYNTWKKTADMDFKSKHLGNVEEDVLETRPEMVVLWAGYAFAMDYKAPRGTCMLSKTIGIPCVQDARKQIPTGLSLLPAGLARVPMFPPA